MEQSIGPNFFEKFKAIVSTAHTSPYFRFFLKKEFSENPVNLDIGI